jgi:hypothetical protein
VKSARQSRLARLGVGLTVAVLAVGSLTACQTKVGAAAFVGSQRISESAVGKYVSRNAKTTTDPSSGTVENPKSEVLTTLIRSAIIDDVFKTLPGNHPTPAELDKGRAAAMTQIGITSISQLEAAAESAGFSAAYASLYIDEQAKIAALGIVLKDPGDGSILSPAIAKVHAKVSVSPRYGDWDSSQLTVGTGPSLPSFLKLAASSAPDGTS